jgi:hypothetical protein
MDTGLLARDEAMAIVITLMVITYPMEIDGSVLESRIDYKDLCVNEKYS